MLKIFLSMVRRNADQQHPESINAVNAVKVAGFPINVEHCVQSEYTDGMSLVPWARNLNIAACLAQGADWIFMVDDDVWFRREDVASAIQANFPIVGMPVFLKTGMDKGTRTFNYSVFPGEDFVVDKDWRHIPRIGTGAMLVKAEVFYAMQKRRPWFACQGYEIMQRDIKGDQSLKIQANCFDYFPTGVRELNGQSVYVGEDYGFCIEADRAGYPTFLHGTSLTAHMIHGSKDGYACDMRAVRKMAVEGRLTQAEAMAL